MKTFSVKNFERFQHYKDRSPPWIKLYNELLDDYSFACLDDAAKFHLIAIWLLASRTDNRIPYDATWVAQRIGARSPVDLDALIEAGFLLLNSNDTETVAPRKHDASKALDQRREETETEKKDAADAAIDLEAVVFNEGSRWLAKRTSKSEQAARGIIGKWVRDHGKERVLEALGTAQRAGPVEPISYIEAILRQKPRARDAPRHPSVIPLGVGG